MIIKKLLGCLFLIYVLFSCRSHAVNIVVNFHQDQKQVEALTKYQLRQIYLMRQKYWPDGQPIIVYALPSESLVHREFSKTVLKMFPYQLDRVWNKLTYSGLGKGPIIVEDEKTLLTALKNTEGAIGYVSKKVTEDALYVVRIK